MKFLFSFLFAGSLIIKCTSAEQCAGGDSDTFVEIGTNPSCKLNKCQGDCDSDSDCGNGMGCHQRSGNAPGPPGCNGTPQDDWDYCYVVQACAGGDSNEYVDIDSNPSGCALSKCQGDCDIDEDCGVGSKCWQRSGNAPGPMQCSNGTPQDSWDYCYKLDDEKCLGSGEMAFSYLLSGTDKCNFATFAERLDAAKSELCPDSGEKILKDLLGSDAEDKIKDLCENAYANTDATSLFSDISNKGFEFDNEYYSGGTFWNYEIETNDGDNNLKDSSARVGRVFREEAQRSIIDLPTYLPSFDPEQDGCDMNAAFCCWSQDRQARDNNGNCNTPYDSQCIDKDPGDNANFCYTDHSRSSTATHVAGGFSIFGDIQNGEENIEGAIHCHGFAWGDDARDSSSIYKGNNLFFISMYDHMYTRGYVRNAPGSAMCGCAENMAVVTRADCTEIESEEEFELSYDVDTSVLSVKLLRIVDVDFNACDGIDANGNDDDNDLESYYRRLVKEGRASQSNFEKLQKILVGDDAGKCNAAIVEFMEEQGIVHSSTSAATANKGDRNEVKVIDPAYMNASEGGDGDMPDAPAEFMKGEFETEDALPEAESGLDEPDVDTKVESTTNDENLIMPGDGARSIDNDTSTVSNGKCKPYCDKDDTTPWDEKCNWVKCRGCDQCGV